MRTSLALNHVTCASAKGAQRNASQVPQDSTLHIVLNEDRWMKHPMALGHKELRPT